MTTANDARKAHKLLDSLFDNSELSHAQIDLIRGLVPEPPAQMTLEELRREVYDVWAGVHGNEWPDDMYCDLETWLYELHQQLKGLAPAKPAHPEFLETEADYQDAPEGTIVDTPGRLAWVKKGANDWTCRGGSNGDYSMALSGRRRVWRWGGKE